jgi:type IV secretion system protein VirB6
MKGFQHSKFFITHSLIGGVLLLCVFLLFPTLVYAGGTGIGLYKDCYFADDFGGRKKDRLLVRPIGKICYERCEIECNGMLGKQEGTEPELNIDLVQKCKKDCRAGDKSKSYPLKVKGADGSVITKPVTIGSACVTGNTAIDANGNNVTRSSFTVKKNDELFIKLFPTANDGYGKLSLCGTDSVVLTPVSESLDDSSWPAFPWSTAASAWGARNPYPVDTGIDVKDGDLISITLETKNGSYFAFKDPQHETSKLWVRNPFGSSEYWSPKNGDSMKNKFSLLADKNLVAIKQNDDGTYEDGVTGSSISDISAVMLANNDVKWNGLSGKADTIPIIDADGKTAGVKRVYKYSGQLKGFSDKFTRLGLMHFENTSSYNSGQWADNLGGFTVNISREGCIYRDGKRLQYAVLKEDTGSTPERTKVYIGV